MQTCDVLVTGGGSAGLAAAVTAARAGASVVLVERHGILGGLATAGLVHTFCGLYQVREQPGAVLANGGFAAEIAAYMVRATGLGPVRVGRLDVLPQHPVEFVRIADELVQAERTLVVRLRTEVCKLWREHDGWVADCWSRDGRQRVRARAIVDASGDAAVAALTNSPYAMANGERLQRPAYIVSVAGVAAKMLDDAARLRLAQRVVAGVKAGELPASALGVTFRSSGRHGEVFLTIDLTAGGDAYDPLAVECLSLLEMEGRAVAAAVVKWLRAAEPAWRGAWIAAWPAQAGVRESRRWVGRVVLTADEWRRGEWFADEVGLATWPMEFRETNRGPKLRFADADAPCGVPAGCLRAAGHDDVFMAGRCISVDHEVQASVRVIGTCFVTGEAAGRMAAESAST